MTSWEKTIRDKIIYSLSIGAIQPFQIEGLLRLKGVPIYKVHHLKKQILESYKRMYPGD